MRRSMKNKTVIITIAVTFLLLALAACSPQQPSTDLQGSERDVVLAYAEPSADNLLQGLKDGDFTAFSKDFDATMRNAINEQKFKDLRTNLEDKMGTYQSRAVDKVTDYGNFVTITYKSTFSKAPSVQILLSFSKDTPHQVSGLYFK
jgi:hypothetical protein